MKLPKNLSIETVMEAVERSERTTDNPGFCLACGEEADGVEPDARNYECDACGAHKVFGAAEILIHLI